MGTRGGQAELDRAAKAVRAGEPTVKQTTVRTQSKETLSPCGRGSGERLRQVHTDKGWCVFRIKEKGGKEITYIANSAPSHQLSRNWEALQKALPGEMVLKVPKKKRPGGSDIGGFPTNFVRISRSKMGFGELCLLGTQRGEKKRTLFLDPEAHQDLFGRHQIAAAKPSRSQALEST